MAQSYTTLVGTVGTGIWTSNDGGERWTRCRGMWNETQVFALTPHPQNPKVVFAGAHDGIPRAQRPAGIEAEDDRAGPARAG